MSGDHSQATRDDEFATVTSTHSSRRVAKRVLPARRFCNPGSPHIANSSAFLTHTTSLDNISSDTRAALPRYRRSRIASSQRPEPDFDNTLQTPFWSHTMISAPRHLLESDTVVASSRCRDVLSQNSPPIRPLFPFLRYREAHEYFSFTVVCKLPPMFSSVALFLSYDSSSMQILRTSSTDDPGHLQFTQSQKKTLAY